MEIIDYSYYKKNALNSFLISKELSNHREALKAEKAKSINDFIIPIFAGTLTISTGFFLKTLEIIENIFWLELIIIIGFILIYYISVFLLKFIRLIWNSAKDSFPWNDSKNREIDTMRIVEVFNIDVINQILLSYTLLKESYDAEKDFNIRKYQIFESFYYLKNAIYKLNENILNKDNLKLLFIENNYQIESYRVKMAMDLIKETYNSLNVSKVDIIELDNDLQVIKETYNRIVENIHPYSIEVELIK